MTITIEQSPSNSHIRHDRMISGSLRAMSCKRTGPGTELANQGDDEFHSQVRWLLIKHDEIGSNMINLCNIHLGS